MVGRRAVVIGAGITGALTARELATRGWTVTVLETAWLGAGSSSRTAAGVRQQFSTPETVRAMRWCVRFFSEWRDRCGGERVPIEQNGYLFLEGDDAHWASAQRRVVVQQGAGLREVEALPADEVRRRFPWVGLESLRGATWCPTDGFLHPELVYGDAMRRAQELGATLVPKAPVTGAAATGDRLTAVTTPKGTFEADLFLDCTNAWTARTGAVLGGEPLPVDPLKRYLWFLRRGGSMSAATLASMPLVILPDGTYVRPENADTLMMGKKHDVAPDPAFSYEDQDTVEPRYAHDSGIDAVPYELWATASESIPQLAEFDGLVATTGGYYGTTPDHNPFLGYDRRRTNLIRLVGFSGHGAMMGPFTGRVAGALADAGGPIAAVDLDGDLVPLDAFAIGRPHVDGEHLVI